MIISRLALMLNYAIVYYWPNIPFAFIIINHPSKVLVCSYILAYILDILALTNTTRTSITRVCNKDLGVSFPFDRWINISSSTSSSSKPLQSYCIGFFNGVAYTHTYSHSDLLWNVTLNTHTQRQDEVEGYDHHHQQTKSLSLSFGLIFLKKNNLSGFESLVTKANSRKRKISQSHQ